MAALTRRENRDVIVEEFKTRSSGSFSTVYRALKSAAEKSGGSHNMQVKAVLEAIDHEKTRIDPKR